jgi:hypothetical protein
MDSSPLHQQGELFGRSRSRHGSLRPSGDELLQLCDELQSVLGCRGAQVVRAFRCQSPLKDKYFMKRGVKLLWAVSST